MIKRIILVSIKMEKTTYIEIHIHYYIEKCNYKNKYYNVKRL